MIIVYKGISPDSKGLRYIISNGRKGDLMAKHPKTGEMEHIRYATNQSSIFTEEQKGQSKVPALLLNDGFMIVDSETQETLVQFMDAHKLNGLKFARVDKEKEAQIDLENEELITDIKSVIRAKSREKDGSIYLESLLLIKSKTISYDKIKDMGPAEIRQDLYKIIDKDPDIFISNSGKVNCFDNNEFMYEDVVIRAISEDIIKVNPRQTQVSWSKSDDGIIEVPKSKNYRKFFASWLMTEDGESTFKEIAEELDY